jgi:hypothetical protein
MKIISKNNVIIFVLVALCVLSAIFFYFWPVSSITKDKMLANINIVSDGLMEGVTPKTIQFSSEEDKIFRCIYPIGQYNVIHNIPDGGSSLYNNKGDLICQRGGIDPLFKQGNCPMFQLCFPIYDNI